MKTAIACRKYVCCLFALFTCLTASGDVWARRKVSREEISEAIEKVRTCATPRICDEATSKLFHLTEDINPKTVDDDTVDAMAALLDIPEVRSSVAVSLGNLNKHARRAVPKLLQVLAEEECNGRFVDIWVLTGPTTINTIKNSLKWIGVKAGPVDCNGNYAAKEMSGDELRNAIAKMRGLPGKGKPNQGTAASVWHNGDTYNPDGIELVYVKGAGDGTISQDFYMGKYEVTQEQWKILMGGATRSIDGENLPVDFVSWDDAREFIARLNAATGRNYRLPTNGEWEFAARGGTAGGSCPEGCRYSGSNDIDEVAWYWDNSGYRPHTVGTKQPNELGIYDMSGNVWEWVSDLYIGGNRPQINDSTERVARGCGWSSGFTQMCLMPSLSIGHIGERYRALGFRVLLPKDK